MQIMASGTPLGEQVVSVQLQDSVQSLQNLHAFSAAVQAITDNLRALSSSQKAPDANVRFM